MATPVTLQCPSCSSPLQQEAVNSETGYIKCAYCGALMTLGGRSSRSTGFRERPALDLPPGMTLNRSPHGIQITRRWFTWAVAFLIPFCLFWDGFLVFWYMAAFKSGAPLPFKLFPLIHVAVGVGLTYYTTASLINRSCITIERGELAISHGPLPWFGYRRIPGVLIDQLYAKARISHGKNGPRTDYQLWLFNSSGRHEKLHANNLSIEQALYLEQQIESALGIKDRAVQGELPR
jgi:hypothetical protein